MAVAGKVAITGGGEWNAETTYERMVAVTYNNNLYLSLKQSTGILPTNKEYWMLSLEGFSGEELQNIIEGTTQVGNAKTLDGYGVEYFAPLADVNKLSHTFRGEISVSDFNDVVEGGTYYCSVQSGAVNTPQGTYNGLLIVDVADNKIYHTFNSSYDFSTIKRVRKNATEWTEWDTDATHADLANYVSHDGGGTVKRAYIAPIVLQNTNSNVSLTGYYGKDGELGYLGFDGKEKPVYGIGGVYKELLHTGNMASYAVPLDGSVPMSGNLIIAGGYGGIAADFESARLECGDRYIAIVNSTGEPDDENDCLYFYNGSKMYPVLYTGNLSKYAAEVEEGTFELVNPDGVTVCFEGKYHKVGKLVYVYGSYTLPTGVSLAWEAPLHGLPFPIATDNANVNFFMLNTQSNASVPHIHYGGAASNIYVAENDYIVSSVSCDAGTTIRLLGIYITSE